MPGVKEAYVLNRLILNCTLVGKKIKYLDLFNMAVAKGCIFKTVSYWICMNEGEWREWREWKNECLPRQKSLQWANRRKETGQTAYAHWTYHNGHTEVILWHNDTWQRNTAVFCKTFVDNRTQYWKTHAMCWIFNSLVPGCHGLKATGKVEIKSILL